MHLGDKTVLQVGEKSFCWIYDDGHSKRIEVETGVSDGEWIEVTNRRAAAAKAEEPWTPFDGTEKMILGNLSILTEGGPVQIAPSPTLPNPVVRPPLRTAVADMMRVWRLSGSPGAVRCRPGAGSPVAPCPLARCCPGAGDR